MPRKGKRHTPGCDSAGAKVFWFFFSKNNTFWFLFRYTMKKFSVLFVCMGNICRSPLAEAAFRAEAEKLGLDVHIDSAGTGGWHAGDPPDPRAQAVARRHGVDISQQRARQVRREDFTTFSHIVALDRDNYAVLGRMRPAHGCAALSLLLDHVEGRAGEPVADPYYGDESGFEITWRDVTQGAAGLARHLATT
jgi:protein-tyrosine phosphatase